MLFLGSLSIAFALALAFTNGSNDVSKGIATLVGSGVASFRRAVLWGAGWTVAGGAVAALAAQGLVATFSGKGFLDPPIGGSSFLAAVAAGAVGWVAFASLTGLPVSTTHAIAGALAGAGLVAQGARHLHWALFAAKIVLPLALSPLLAIALIQVVLPVLRRPMAKVEAYCLCIERRVAVASVGVLAMTTETRPLLGNGEACAVSPAIAARLSLVDALHWLSAALTSFARGLNDAPKIVALGIAAAVGFGMPSLPFYGAVAVGMGAGSVVAGFRVTRTLAQKITSMSPAEGFAANAVTTLLVGLASSAALPVSTTHVSAGAVIGLGIHRDAGGVRWHTVRELLLAWLVTLPAAALLGGGAFVLMARA